MGVNSCGAETFFIVPARNRENLDAKIAELQRMNVSFIIVCGEKVNHPNVVYQENRGKWAAINFATKFIPKEAKVIVLNDVDTKIHNFKLAFAYLSEKIALVYCRVQLSQGPQVKFYRILNPWRKHFHIFPSGELMLIRKEIFERVLPLPACIAEDSYILFKTLELGYQAKFCASAYVTTERTHNAEEEASYKNRTTLGIYQALECTKPPPMIRVIYAILPLLAPMLSLMGEDGQAWTKGINRALKYYLTKERPSKF